MKNRMSVFVMIALVMSLIAYGCTASGSVSTNKQQNQKSSAAHR